jgi:hypothetical protein
MPANAMEELKDLDKELENADVQSGNTTSDHQEQSSDEDAPAPVQEGKVNDNDASELLEDPQADASSDKGLVATRQEELLAQANKPFEKPPLELPIREGVVEDTKQQLKAESNKPFEKPPVKIPVRKGQVPDTIEFFENLAAGNKRSAKSSKQASGTGQSERD